MQICSTFTSGYFLCLQVLVRDPRQRLTAKEALQDPFVLQAGDLGQCLAVWASAGCELMARMAYSIDDRL